MKYNDKHDRVRRLTVCAMSAAISFVLLFIGGTSGIFDMSAVALCGLITVIAVTEAGVRLAVGAVAVCSVLTLILLPDKSVGILYIMAGGLYPLAKPAAERFGKILQWVVKIAVAEMIIGIYTAFMMLFMPEEAEGFLVPLAFILGTVCFILYDVLLTRFAAIYRLRRR